MNPIKSGKKLRELRGDTRMEVVCAACGISVSALSLYENGRRVPRDDIKIKLANFFGRNVQEIFFEL